MADTYSLEDYVADLRAIAGETDDELEIMKRVRPLARKAATDPEWLTEQIYTCDEAQGVGVHLLHEEDDHSLAVFAVSWLPNRGVPPHDHGTWAVVAGVDGPERNVFYARLDNGSRPDYAEIKEESSKDFGPGEVLSLRSGAVHSVWNHGERISVSLHTYGKHTNHTSRSQFDPETNKAEPFILKIEEKIGESV